MTPADYDRLLDPFATPEEAETALADDFARRTPEERHDLMAAMARRWNYGPHPATWPVQLLSLIDGEWQVTETFESSRPLRQFP